MTSHINISGPWITQKEIDCVTDAVTNAWYDNAGIYVKKFEESFANYVERKYAIALPSCTSAIHLALLSLGITRGDEVIVPDITWIASSAPITYVGAIPVFADIDKDTWCISSNSFEDLITDRTKAVIPVDLYGNMSDMDKITKIAKNNNIYMIEDAAEAIGSEYKNKKAGSFGDVSVFSFHGTKTLTTGEGGMLVTDDRHIYERCLFLSNHCKDSQSDKLFWNTEIGYKYKMTDMQAALGLAQLERIEELVAKKRQIFEWYKEELSGLTKNGIIILNTELYNTKNSYWMPTMIINPELNITKEMIIKPMRNKNVDCRPFFYPLSSLPAYNNLKNIEKYRKYNKNSYEISPYGTNLPSNMNINVYNVKYICNILKYILYK